MPREIRHVIFSVEEVLAALRCYGERSGEPLPFAVRGELASDEKGAPGVRVTPAVPAGPSQLIAGDRLVASLLLYCRERRIPLPARAGKTLGIVGGQLALILTMLQ